MRDFKSILLVGVGLALLSSCNIVNDIVKTPVRDSNSKSAVTAAAGGNESRKAGSDRAMRRFFSKKNKTKSEPTSPAAQSGDKQAAKAINTADTASVGRNPAPAAVKTVDSREFSAIENHINGEWMFDNAWGKSVPGEDDRPSIIFESSRNRFYCFNGCNYINGGFSISAGDRITFDNVISTQEYCADDPQSSELTALINQARYYNIISFKSEEYLELINDRKQKIGTLHRHCIDALNGMWEVESVGTAKIDRTTPPTIVIDLLEKHIHGHTGCNLFNGTIYQDPDKETSVQFQGMKVTKVKCPNVAVEMSLLVALERVEHVALDGDTKATLLDADGNVLITLVRTEI